MDKTELQRFLDKHGACSEARQWVADNNLTTLADAWDKCPNVSWMLWALGRSGYRDERTMRLFACWCVRNTPLPDGRKVWDLLTDERSRGAVEVAECFADGRPAKKELAAAYVAAYAAAYDAANAAAYDAANAAAYAAAFEARDAASAAAYEAREAARDAAAAARAADAYAAAAARVAAADAADANAAYAAADAAYAAAAARAADAAAAAARVAAVYAADANAAYAAAADAAADAAAAQADGLRLIIGNPYAGTQLQELLP